MPSYSVRVQWKGLNELKRMMDPGSIKAALNDGLTDVALDVQGRARSKVPVKTGRLASTIRVYGRMTGPTRTIVAGTTSVRYAASVHEGTGIYGPTGKPYVIRPRTKKALAFPSQRITTARFGSRAKLGFRLSGKLSARSQRRYGNAAYVVVKKVVNPGQKGVPFMKDALYETPAAKLLAQAMYRHYRRAQGV